MALKPAIIRETSSDAGMTRSQGLLTQITSDATHLIKDAISSSPNISGVLVPDVVTQIMRCLDGLPN